MQGFCKILGVVVCEGCKTCGRNGCEVCKVLMESGEAYANLLTEKAAGCDGMRIWRAAEAGRVAFGGGVVSVPHPERWRKGPCHGTARAVRYHGLQRSVLALKDRRRRAWRFHSGNRSGSTRLRDGESAGLV